MGVGDFVQDQAGPFPGLIVCQTPPVAATGVIRFQQFLAAYAAGNYMEIPSEPV
jgi:hypothetical protein